MLGSAEYQLHEDVTPVPKHLGNFVTRYVWMVNSTPLLFYPWERSGTKCTRSWVGHRAYPDGCEKSCLTLGLEPLTFQIST